MGHLQPLNIFLRQEIDRMRKVLTIVKATLTDLKLAIDGTIIMNEVRICIRKSYSVACDFNVCNQVLIASLSPRPNFFTSRPGPRPEGRG